MSINALTTGENGSLASRTYGTARFHTDGELAALAYAADGTLWSVEEPGVLRQWDETGRQLARHFLLDLDTIWAFGPLARQLAAACDEVVIWDVAGHRQVARFDVPSWVTAAAFGPDGAALATGHDDGVVRLWDVAAQELVLEMSEHKLPVSAVAFSADGRRLASAGEDRLICVWESAGGRLVKSLTGHTDRIPGLAWHPAGRLIVSVGWDATARVWDVASGEPRILLNTHDDQVETLAFAPNGTMLATSDSASVVHVWGDLLAAQALHRLPGYSEEVRALAFRPDGRCLAVGGSDRVIHIYDPQSGRLIGGRPDGSRHAIAVWDRGGQPVLVSNSGPDGMRLWDVAGGSELPSPLPAGQYRHIASSPDGKWLAAVGDDATIHLTDGHVHKLLDGPKTAPALLTFSPDSQTLAAAVINEGTAWLWSLSTFEPTLLVIEATLGSSVESVAFQPDGRRLLCGGIDFLSTSGSSGAVCLWDLAEKSRVLNIMGGATSVAFDPSGRQFATASPDGQVTIYSTDTGEVNVSIAGRSEGSRVLALAYSFDGACLLASDDDGMLRGWDTTTGSVLLARQFPSPLVSLIVRPDGRLFGGHANGTASEFRLRDLMDEA